ncbi:MAG: TonB-dependent receptor [Cyclobacteriaceae bacterium]
MAQRLGSAKGLVLDASKNPVPFATLALERSADSSLIRAIYANEQGEFVFDNLPLQSYLLEVSALGYSSTFIRFNLSKDHLFADLTNIRLGVTISLLKEVVIVHEREKEVTDTVPMDTAPFVDTVPVVIPKKNIVSFVNVKNDTLGFNMANRPSKKSDVAEDLLKKLPGIMSDENGNLQSEGEQVVKILVDGEEYFGDNVEIALKNIPAEIIEKVEIIENSKGEGKKINITVKEERKNVPFGDLQEGLGTKNRYQAKAIVNRFGDKLKLTGIGDLNNINRTNIQFKKRKKLFEDPLDNPIDPKSGVTQSAGLGLNLNYTPNKKQSLTASYIYNQADRALFRKVNRVFVTDDLPFDTFQEADQPFKSRKHELHTTYKQSFTINESILKTQLSFNYVDGFKNTTDLLNLFSDQFQLTRSIGNDIDDDNSTYKSSIRLDLKQPILKKQFTKEDKRYIDTYLTLNHNKGKSKGPFSRNTLSSQSILTNNRTGNNNAENKLFKTTLGFNYKHTLPKKQDVKVGGSIFYDKNSNNRLIVTDNTNFDSNGDFANSSTGSIQQNQSGRNIGWEANAEYGRPLGKRSKASITYDVNHTVSLSERTRLNLNEDFFVIDTNASTAFEKNYFFQRPGLRYTWSSPRTTLDIGAKIQLSTLKGENTLLGARLTKHFINPSSYANLTVHLDSVKAERLKISLSSSVVEPRIDQLQPITIFYSPVRLFTGNPNLDLEQRYKANISYLKLNQETKSSFSSSLSASVTDDKIYNELSIDTTTFVRTTTPLNGIFQYSIDGRVQWKWNLKENGATLTSSLRMARDITPFTYQSSLTEENIKTNKNSISVMFDNNQQTVPLKYAICSAINNQKTVYPILDENNGDGVIKKASIRSQKHSGSVSYEYLKKWTFGSSLSYQIFSAILNGNNQPRLTRDLEVVKLDAYVQRSILDDKAYVRFYADDLLNQNRGIKSRTSGTFIEREEIATIKRYYMISFLYYFSGNKKGKV